MILEDKLKELNKKGFFTIESFFNKEETTIMSNARNKLVTNSKRLKDKIKDDKVEHQGSTYVYWNGKPKLVSWAGNSKQTFFHYGRDQRILNIVKEVFKHDKAQHLINQVHFKLPGVSDIYPMHLDIVHRESRGWDNSVNGGVNYIQIVVALDIITEANGALRFVPGYIGEADISYNRDKELNEDLYRISEPIIMNPGDIAVFNSYVPHGSGVNLVDRARGLFVTGFAYPGACTSLKNYPGEGVGKIINLIKEEPDYDTWMNEGGSIL